MKNHLKSFFTFSAKERKGTILLILILVIVIVVYQFKPFIKDETYFDEEVIFLEYQEFMSHLEKKRENKNEKAINTTPFEKKNIETELFFFDPNKTGIDSLKRLGIREYIAVRICNYRNKGGRFYRKKDLLKIYDFDTLKYSELEPYIVIPEKEDTLVPKDIKKEVKLKKIELNAASRDDLMTLYGIGEVLSQRIIKYRDLLGGFYSILQLQEVYGLEDSTLNPILERVYADSLIIRKMNINKVTEKNLGNHPYMSNEDARSIIFYRETMKVVKSSDELILNKIIDQRTLKKMEPYLSFE